MFLTRVSTLLLAAAMVLLSACNSVKQEASTDSGIKEIYEVHEDGRIYAFYDRALYKEFLSVGETAYRLTRIGSGPNGETMVFGLTKADKKKGANTAAVKLFENKLNPAEDFYAETVRHGRIYVFNKFEDMQPVRQFGHPNFFYMEVGAGPKGETVVYVLNKSNKKDKPVELIKRFKQHNA
ncbi:MAG: hypothetical protein OQL09_05515 [Gammaproteobacteria bacterium]|nr:hypothetical protein [Gammaproteobacteria bacterium]